MAAHAACWHVAIGTPQLSRMGLSVPMACFNHEVAEGIACLCEKAEHVRLHPEAETAHRQVIGVITEWVLYLHCQLLDREHEERDKRDHGDHDPAEDIDQSEGQHHHPREADQP